jgi:hypothetical protein
MHPVLSQAVGATRDRDRQAYVASRRLVAEARRARPGRRVTFIRVRDAGLGSRALRTLRPPRAPRPA